jgi:hypothetical protein
MKDKIENNLQISPLPLVTPLLPPYPKGGMEGEQEGGYHPYESQKNQI